MNDLVATNKLDDKTIGDILAKYKGLSDEDVRRILEFQVQNGVKFGEAAVRLGYASREDILWALSQQFNYSYPQPSEKSKDPRTDLVTAYFPFDDSAEFFRDLRTQIIEGLGEEKIASAVIGVVSSNRHDGKTYCASNLAITLSQLGKRTILVDADLRAGQIERIFSVESRQAGLSAVLSGKSEINVVRPMPELPHLYVLGVGTTPPNPLELLQSSMFNVLVENLKQRFEFVVFDTPAHDLGADCRIVANKSDVCIVMAKQNESRKKDLEKLVGIVKKMKPRLTMVIMNQGQS